MRKDTILPHNVFYNRKTLDSYSAVSLYTLRLRKWETPIAIFYKFDNGTQTLIAFDGNENGMVEEFEIRDITLNTSLRAGHWLSSQQQLPAFTISSNLIPYKRNFTVQVDLYKNTLGLWEKEYIVGKFTNLMLSGSKKINGYSVLFTTPQPSTLRTFSDERETLTVAYQGNDSVISIRDIRKSIDTFDIYGSSYVFNGVHSKRNKIWLRKVGTKKHFAGNQESNQLLRDFRLDSMFRINNLTNRVKVLSFWGSWCAPCRSNFPLLARLDSQYRTIADIVTIAVETSASPTDAFEELKEMNFTLPTYIETSAFQNELDESKFSRKYNILGLPTFLVVLDNIVVLRTPRIDQVESKLKKLKADFF